MDIVTTQTSSSASVFDASMKDPQLGVSSAIAEVRRLLSKYAEQEDVMVRMQLLTEVEALRRFVLVRGALLRALKETGSKGVSLGRELCDSLRGMIGDAPDTVKSCSLQGARNMERDTRRAVASLAFIGSLDSSFVD
ncbi:hypothetical protein DK847_10435 [Aestuariivirga litoralis]|uniref:Uncharacterized protein n=1 Tax=Aestuariivirga litoralis TaxID=2650924 RepID=A0A2W2AN06_9HYPH|nr:hypothetical protein [Aestuariivirga litoralis]PZF76875.1 hypothetical protein DK847_10435 [Aestuariivirga litoralis]